MYGDSAWAGPRGGASLEFAEGGRWAAVKRASIRQASPMDVTHGMADIEPGLRLEEAVQAPLGLPDGSGLDLMRQLHARYGMRGIALSGYGMDEDVSRSRAAGWVRSVGVVMQTAPWNSPAWANCTPRFSLPAIGWLPT